jgi:hypothetical protein
MASKSFGWFVADLRRRAVLTKVALPVLVVWDELLRHRGSLSSPRVPAPPRHDRRRLVTRHWHHARFDLTVAAR